MRVVFMGTPDFAVGTLEALVENDYEVIQVITQPDRRRGRGKKVHPTAVKKRALELGLEVFQPEKVRKEENISYIRELKPDIIIVVAFGQILPEELLEIPKYGCINVHASLLPKYRGAAPIHWAIIDGEKETGVTTMQMDAGLDTGDMLLKVKVPIDLNMNTGQLHDLLAIKGANLLIETLKKLEEGSLEPKRQDDSLSNYAEMLEKKHEKIDWSKASLDVHNQIRGLNPWPGCYTFYEGKRLKVFKTSLEDRENIERKGTPGMILAFNDLGFFVETKDSVILIEEVQPAGKKRMSAVDFMNGYKLKTGAILGEESAGN